MASPSSLMSSTGFGGECRPCAQGLDKYPRTIYLGTFSKTLYPGLRMGYMVVPFERVKAFTYSSLTAYEIEAAMLRLANSLSKK